MVNYNKQRGTKFEHRICKKEKDAGAIAARSAGSHSEVDVWSLNEKDKVIKVIQCKPASMKDTPAGRRLEEEFGRLSGQYVVYAKVVYTRKIDMVRKSDRKKETTTEML